MIDYPDYKYLYPPRPETAIPKQQLGFYQKRDWWAQVKKNGTNNVIFARRNEVIFKTRHNDDHKLWKPEGDHNAFFAGSKNWNVFCSELLHSKTKHLKNEIYIFDILVHDGASLVGTTFADRQELLHNMFQGSDEGDQVRIANRITLAKCFNEDFAELFNSLKPEDEGLVLKNPNGILEPCFHASSNSGWQVKARLPAPNYSF